MAYNDNNNRDSAPAAQTADDARRQVESIRNASQRQILSSLGVREDKKTHVHRWLWFEVPKEAVPALDLMGNTLSRFVGKWAGSAVYDHSSALYLQAGKWLGKNFSEDAAHKVGLRAALGVNALLIGAQPVSQAINLVRDRIKQRKETQQELSAIFATDKNAYEHNSVIRTAMDAANEHMSHGFKLLMADMPTVIMNAYFARGDHKELVEKKTLQKNYNQRMTGGVSAQAQALREFNANKNAEKALEEAAYKKQHGGLEGFQAHWQQYEDHFNSEWNEQRRARYQQPVTQYKSDSGMDSATGQFLAINAVGATGLMFKSYANKGWKGDVNAWEKIKSLEALARSGRLRGVDLTEKIVEIFQQDEIDQNKNNKSHTTFGPALLEKLEPLAQRIGEVLANGELDVRALVNLVGQGKVVNNRRFISPEQLEQLIDEQRKIYSAREKKTLNEMLADHLNPQQVFEVIKKNLKDFKGAERALFASMLPDDVLIAADIKEAEIPALRRQGHDPMFGFVAAQTMELSKKSDEELKSKNLSEKQVAGIRKLSRVLEQGNEKELKSIIDRGGEVVGAVRKVLLEDQVTAPEATEKRWADGVKKVATPAEIVAAVKNKKEERELVEPEGDMVADGVGEDYEEKPHHRRHSSHRKSAGSAVSRLENGRSQEDVGLGHA